MDTLIQVIRDSSVVETLPLTVTNVVEIFNPGPQGAKGPAGGLILPYTTDFMRIKATGELQVWNSDQSKFHTLLVQGNAGEEYLTIGAGES